MEKVQEIATNNSIQVSKAVIKENGYEFNEHEIVTLKAKLPTILNVKEFTTKETY